MGPQAGAADYISAYDTTTQTITGSAGTFQNVNFSNNALLNGWTHTAGAAPFTCPAKGIYEIGWTCIPTSSTVTATISFRILQNSVEVPGSQTATDITTVNIARTSTNTILVNCNVNDVFILQMASNQAASASSIRTDGTGTTPTSATIVFTPIGSNGDQGPTGPAGPAASSVTSNAMSANNTAGSSMTVTTSTPAPVPLPNTQVLNGGWTANGTLLFLVLLVFYNCLVV
jgi:hypothetical protein